MSDDKKTARDTIQKLVDQFCRNEDDYTRAAYNETQARTDFITPLLEAFGWDVHNKKGYTLSLREVIEEATVEVGEEGARKKPDYELRIARQRKLFVEAKKPSVRIEKDKASAFQARRYGYSANLPISILTNFKQIAVYDCRPAPSAEDEAHVARLLVVNHTDFIAHFDQLWETLSRDSVYSGEFDKHFAVSISRHGSEQFDDLFLRQVRNWRARLALDIKKHTPDLSANELTYAVQIFLLRIVFLRICEDRDIEKYETLKDLDAANTYGALRRELERADSFYDSGLFRLLDDEALNITIGDEVLKEIISELYYPQSPYTFSVVEPEVLGEIYEQFLGEVISLDDGTVEIVTKPEIRESGGVVPTPRFIADRIVAQTLSPCLEDKAPKELKTFTVADICCGSGVFLLSVYEFLLGHYLNWYMSNTPESHAGQSIVEVGAGVWRLTFEEKRKILLTHIRGIDIDANAVEVAQFSLLLKLVEDETEADLRNYVAVNKVPALPDLDDILRSGNSLVSHEEWGHTGLPLSNEINEAIVPITWQEEFPDEFGRGGFDCIVGNPPYIRIQNMTKYSPDEVTFYKHKSSPYSTAQSDNFDKYALFIERAMSLTNQHGRVGYIVPYKFMTIQSGRALRQLISSNLALESIVHFGTQQVFGGRSNYTCILNLCNEATPEVLFESAGPLEQWRYGEKGEISKLSPEDFSANSWMIADNAFKTIIQDTRKRHPQELKDVADIFVGVQTSADAVYILHPKEETDHSVRVTLDDEVYDIEKEILRPCLHDVTICSYEPPKANAWMIFPYEYETDDRGKTRAKLIQPHAMEAFPECWRYLNDNKVVLGKRNVTGGPKDEQQWYQFGRSQSLVKFNMPKIILPILSLEPKYSHDNDNIVVTGGGNGPYYMIRTKDRGAMTNRYLIAVLNHPLCEAMIRTNTSPFRGGYYSHGKQFIQGLPIPIPTEEQLDNIHDLVVRMETSIQAVTEARIPREKKARNGVVKRNRKAIEDAVTDLFGLSPEDLEKIRQVPIPE